MAFRWQTRGGIWQTVEPLSDFSRPQAERQNCEWLYYTHSIHGRCLCHWQGAPRRIHHRATNVTRPNTRCSINWSSNTIRYLKPHWRTRDKACLTTFSNNSMTSSSIVAWNMVSCGYAVRIAIMSAWWPSVANDVDSAPVAAPAGWLKAPPYRSMRSFLRRPFASGYCAFPFNVTVHSPTSLTLCLQGRSHRVFSESGFPDSRR